MGGVYRDGCATCRMLAVSTLDLFKDRDTDDGPEKAKKPQKPKKPSVLRVAEVNRAVRSRLEATFGDVWVEGELSDVTRAASGHVYFTLNDENEPAQLKGVMFRGDARRAKARLERGAVVRMRGQLTLYEARGNFQMVARVALPAGAGDLHAEFERIRRKLDAEGLFSDELKRPLPRFPRVVGVVTSAAGAAMHDVVRVAAGRCPVRIVVADCRVQGKEAPGSIIRALRMIQRLPGLDAVIIGRGGGSQEDLWAFNDEAVAREIAACAVPIISGVGHEVDITIADLVADVRASTPSNAAEILVPDRRALLDRLEGYERRISRALDARISGERLGLERLHRDLGDPRHRLGRARAKLDAHSGRANQEIVSRLRRERQRLGELSAAVRRHDPRARLARNRGRHTELDGRLRAALRPRLAADRDALRSHLERLRHATETRLARQKAALGQAVAGLEAMSPLSVLSRGYAIALHGETGEALTRASQAEVGDSLDLVLHEGRVTAEVVALTDADADPGAQE